MKNKILAIILTMSLLFSLAAINASAAIIPSEPYFIVLHSDGVINTGDNCKIADKTANSIKTNYGISWDSTQKAWIFDNTQITDTDITNVSANGAVYLIGSCKVILKGNCSIASTSAAAIASSADLTIEGQTGATLTVTTPNTAIYAKGNITIENTTISALNVLNGIYAEGNVTVNDSTLNIRANVSGMGIYAGGDVTITSTYLQELSGKNAIKAGGTVSINESSGFIAADCLAIDAASISITENMTLKAGNNLIDAKTIDTSKSSGSSRADWSSYKYAQFSTKYSIKGDNPTWIKGSTDGATITSTASLSLFTTVKVDDHFVDESDYTAESGSTKISFTPSYLETLDIGDHEVTIVSKTGTATGTLTIKEATKEEEPTTETTIKETKTEDKVADTSDNSAIAALVALTAFSAAGFASLKKKEN